MANPRKPHVRSYHICVKDGTERAYFVWTHHKQSPGPHVNRDWVVGVGPDGIQLGRAWVTDLSTGRVSGLLTEPDAEALEKLLRAARRYVAKNTFSCRRCPAELKPGESRKGWRIESTSGLDDDPYADDLCPRCYSEVCRVGRPS